MERVLIKDISKYIKKNVLLKGRVFNVRKLGGISFILLQDYTGSVQAVFEKETKAKIGDVVELKGKAKSEKRAKGGFEITGEEINIVSSAVKEIPFDFSKNKLNLHLNTLLDFRAVSLRHPRIQAIFQLYNLLLEGYESIMREQGFTEIKTPKILKAASEGGANFFKIKYFNTDAYLAQSPQFYKQIMVGVFERVFEIGPVFRAEPHFTTRHVNEYVSLDAEMGFIQDFYEVTAMLNKILLKLFKTLEESGADYLRFYDTKIPKVPEKIPHIKLGELKKIIKQKYGYAIPENADIDPEGERLAGKYALDEYKSDFIFVTHYPWESRPFYTMRSRENPKETYGFDLLLRGMEIATGSQRVNLYDELVDNMKNKHIKPNGMEFYLETFKFAMPPHGGWGMGSERLIQQILGLKNIKEAILFPRDTKRLSP